jgi:hypothetical protein
VAGIEGGWILTIESVLVSGVVAEVDIIGLVVGKLLVVEVEV